MPRRRDSSSSAVRIVAVADTHLFHDELEVPDGDVLVHAGDLCRGGSFDELVEATRWLRTLPHRVKIVIAGNHDWAFATAKAAARALVASEADPSGTASGRIVYLEDEGCEVLGLRFWGSPWQPTFHDWAFNLPRGAKLAKRWALVPEGLDVLITHGPPAGIGDKSSLGGVRQGCVDLRARVRSARPRLHLFGHIHEDGGAWHDEDTTFVNCTTWECERPPTVIDLEPGTRAPPVVTAPRARRAR